MVVILLQEQKLGWWSNVLQEDRRSSYVTVILAVYVDGIARKASRFLTPSQLGFSSPRPGQTSLFSNMFDWLEKSHFNSSLSSGLQGSKPPVATAARMETTQNEWCILIVAKVILSNSIYYEVIVDQRRNWCRDVNYPSDVGIFSLSINARKLMFFLFVWKKDKYIY